MWRVLGLGGRGEGIESPSLVLDALGCTFLGPYSEDPCTPSSHPQLSEPLLPVHPGAPRVSRELEATVEPPQFLPSRCHLSAGSSVILSVVRLENQRLAFFRLPCLLLVLTLGWGRARPGQGLLSLFLGPRWLCGTLDQRHFTGVPISDMPPPCQGEVLYALWPVGLITSSGRYCCATLQRGKQRLREGKCLGQGGVASW